jgi:translation initiation factor 3 subunit B
MIATSLKSFPAGYQITSIEVIVPMAVVAASHLLWPFALNPWFLSFSVSIARYSLKQESHADDAVLIPAPLSLVETFIVDVPEYAIDVTQNCHIALPAVSFSSCNFKVVLNTRYPIVVVFHPYIYLSIKYAHTMSDNQELNNIQFTEEEQAEFDAELEEAFADIEAKYAVDASEGFENVIVVDNLPIVDESKRQRLVERLRQIFDKAGAGIEEDRISMPWDDEAKTNKGYVCFLCHRVVTNCRFLFLTYPDSKSAENALVVLDGTAFGKAHTLYVNRFGDIERYANLPIGEGELPSGWKEKPYTERVCQGMITDKFHTDKQDHLRSWLGDRLGRDQFLTFADATANLQWCGRNANLETVRGSQNQPVKNAKWGELYLSWSPLGTYLASTHRAGVALWCGPDLGGDPNVRLIQFSPCENYLVTWSDIPCVDIADHASPAVRDTFNSADDEGFQFAIWDIKSQKPLRTFPADDSDHTGSISWPVMKWSPDDKYIAKCNIGVGISVYELPHMGMLDRKSVKIEGVQDFEWCPMSESDFEDRRKGKGKECTIAYWSPEAPNQPARVQLMALPSRTVLRSKNLFNVTEVSCLTIISSYHR